MCLACIPDAKDRCVMSLIVAKPSHLSRNDNSYLCNEQTYGLLNSFFQVVPFLYKVW